VFFLEVLSELLTIELTKHGSDRSSNSYFPKPSKTTGESNRERDTNRNTKKALGGRLGLLGSFLASLCFLG
jgi:hypothetical protein